MNEKLDIRCFIDNLLFVAAEAEAETLSVHRATFTTSIKRLLAHVPFLTGVVTIKPGSFLWHLCSKSGLMHLYHMQIWLPPYYFFRSSCHIFGCHQIRQRSIYFQLYFRINRFVDAYPNTCENVRWLQLLRNKLQLDFIFENNNHVITSFNIFGISVRDFFLI